MTRSEEELRVGTAQRERVAEQVRKEQIEVQDEDGKGGRHERRRRR
jgi:hypothetical protein